MILVYIRINRFGGYLVDIVLDYRYSSGIVPSGILLGSDTVVIHIQNTYLQYCNLYYYDPTHIVPLCSCVYCSLYIYFIVRMIKSKNEIICS